VKKTLISLMLCLTVVAIATSAMAASKDDIVLSKDMRTTIVTHPAPGRQPYTEDNTKLTTIFDNLGGYYPDGVYWCCEGGTIWGPDETLTNPSITYWDAVAFTPSTSLSVTKISVAVGFVNYGEKYDDFILSLNNDSSNTPGTVIKQWKVTNLPTFGSCCTVETKGDAAGIPVTAGTQYWVVVSTEKKSDVWAAWNVNDTKQLSTDAITESFYCYSTDSSDCSYNGQWYTYSGYPGYSVGVWGK